MKIIGLYKKILKNNWHFIKIMAGVFILGIYIGFFSGRLWPEQLAKPVLSTFQFKFEQTRGKIKDLYRDYKNNPPRISTPEFTWNSAIKLFIRNLKVAIYSLFLGIALGYYSIFVILFNGYFIGAYLAVITATHESPWQYALYFFTALIPHGFFELSALIIAASFGLRLGWFWKIKEGSNNKEKLLICLKQNIQMIPLIAILLLIAAIIEKSVHITIFFPS